MSFLSIHANHRFQVEIDGIGQAAFSEVQLPESSVEVIDYRDGNEIGTRKLPGLRKYSNLTLKRGVTTSDELFKWWKTVAEGQTELRNVAVILLDEQRSPVKRWNMRNAWPARYAVSPLVAIDGCVVVTETLECAVESLEAESG
jgi:phage tail-like protein